MTDAATVKAVITNLETIISSTIGWKLEDLSTDHEARTYIVAQLDYDGEDPDDTFKERPSRPEINFTIKAQKTVVLPGDARDIAVDMVHAVETYVTVASLNVGSLSSSKLVSRVSHGSPTITREKIKVSMSYPIKVRYRGDL